MSKEDLILNIQQLWRCDDKRPSDIKRKETEQLIDEYLQTTECEHPFALVQSKCSEELNYCLQCGKNL